MTSRRRARERAEIEVRARERDHVLRLAPREADDDEVAAVQPAPRARASGTPTRRVPSPKRSTNRERIAAAARSEICCVVIATTSASNGRGFSVGRKPASAAHDRAEHRIAVGPGAKRLEVEREPEQPTRPPLDLGSRRLDANATAAQARSGPRVPATTRWRPP